MVKGRRPIFWLISIVVALISLLIFYDERVESRFPTFVDIPEQSGIWTWLPCFFPRSASSIRVVTNLDANLFYADFSLKKWEDRNKFEADLAGVNAETTYKIVQQNWCRIDKIIGNSDAPAQQFYIEKTSADSYRITNDKSECPGE